MKRRSLSRVFFLYKFPGEKMQFPTCLEDLPPEEQKKVLSTMSRQYLENYCMMVADALRSIGDDLDIYTEGNEAAKEKLKHQNDHL